MPETATQPSETEQRTAPGEEPTPRTPLGDVASRIPELTGQYEQAQAKVREGLKAKSEAMAPAIQEAGAALQYQRPMPPPPPIITQPPSRKLTEFLAPVEGEAPETSVLKLIQAIGLFATGISGSARGDARAGLAAFTGALKGWHAGDKERADRHFADWQANTETALNKWKIERTTYQDIMESANLSIEQKYKMVQLKALDEDNKMLADVAAKGDLQGLLGILNQQQQHADSVAHWKAQIATQYAIVQLREARKKEQEQEILDAYSPEDIAMLGQQWATTGKFPPGLGRSGPQSIIRARITSAAREWMRERGIDPMTAPALQAEVGSLRLAMNDIQKRTAFTMANVGAFEKHMEQLVALGKRAERGQSPVINRVQLKLKGEYQGDADVAAFQAMAFEAAQEFAKISVGTAQGDEASRGQAREAINTALNQDQLVAVSDNLKLAARRRLEGYREQFRDLTTQMEGLTTGAPRVAPTPTPVTPNQGKLRVIRKSDRQPGTIDAKDMSDLYEVVQ